MLLQLLGPGAGNSSEVSIGFIHLGNAARADRLPALELEDAHPVLTEGLPQELVGVAPRVRAHLDVQFGKLVTEGLREEVPAGAGPLAQLDTELSVPGSQG